MNSTNFTIYLEKFAKFSILEVFLNPRGGLGLLFFELVRMAAADVVIFGVVLHLFQEAFWKIPIIIFPQSRKVDSYNKNLNKKILEHGNRLFIVFGIIIEYRSFNGFWPLETTRDYSS
jgi:hypothetical protein